MPTFGIHVDYAGDWNVRPSTLHDYIGLRATCKPFGTLDAHDPYALADLDDTPGGIAVDLRPAALWSDGAPVVASELRSSFEAMFRSNPLYSLSGFTGSASISSASRLVLGTHDRSTKAVRLLCDPWCSPLPKRRGDGALVHGAFEPVGSRAFCSRSDPSRRVELRVIDAADDVVRKLSAGEIVATSPSAFDVIERVADLPGFRWGRSNLFPMLLLNPARSALSDYEFRMSLGSAFSVPPLSPLLLPAGVYAASDRPRRRLAASSTIAYADYWPNRPCAERIARILEEAGIETSLDPLPLDELAARTACGDYEAALIILAEPFELHDGLFAALSRILSSLAPETEWPRRVRAAVRDWRSGGSAVPLLPVLLRYAPAVPLGIFRTGYATTPAGSCLKPTAWGYTVECLA